MAYPVEFPEQNAVLQKPANMTEEECRSLPILRKDGQCISVWKLTPEEMVSVNLTQSVVVGVLSGHTQPPIWIEAAAPAEAGELPEETQLQMNLVEELGTLGVRVFLFSDQLDEIEKKRGEKLLEYLKAALHTYKEATHK
ncbi:hypothetical protein [Hymenobacter sediminicola]|uniref:Uncharacterized protein n=1 Tax=Hymenobacter sediminicola TaxID=2761579 RepID=A0A7G7W2Z8_9BACT|nr:hypothetical protein [Hymenobacter sediminicola]QNH60741.1 hypothetical protein H4317_11115 [Hymenobacter sediminicola]